MTSILNRPRYQSWYSYDCRTRQNLEYKLPGACNTNTMAQSLCDYYGGLSVSPGCFASAACLGPGRLRELPEYVALEYRTRFHHICLLPCARYWLSYLTGPVHSVGAAPHQQRTRTYPMLVRCSLDSVIGVLFRCTPLWPVLVACPAGSERARASYFTKFGWGIFF